ncbi:MAG: hypothetical protein H6637_05375 [Ardenticatenales bacterium]|nr:hypothetical protein [Ardenticatenales bacterium]
MANTKWVGSRGAHGVGGVRRRPLSRLDKALAGIEELARREPVTPEGADRPLLPLPATVTITDAEKDEAFETWDDLMPEYAGLWDAEVGEE